MFFLLVMGWATLTLGCSGDKSSTAEDDTGGPGTPSFPAGALVLDHVRVVDAATVREDVAVVIAGGETWSVVQAGQDWPEDAVVHDHAGIADATVVPGLIDAHTHLFHSGSTWWIGPALAENLAAHLAWGVLGVADLGSPVEIFTLRDRIAAGEILGPRIWATGPFITAVLSHPCETYNDDRFCRFVEGDGADAVAELEDSDGIKAVLADADFTDWPTPRLDLADLAEITATAAEQGKPVWVHVDEEEDANDALAAGAAVLAHPVFSEILTHSPDAPVTSTLSAFANLGHLFDGSLLADDLTWTPEDVVFNWTWLAEHPEAYAEGWIDASAGWAAAAETNLALAIAEARPVMTGSDAGYWYVPHGLGLHHELATLVRLGMDPQSALGAATSVPADLLGWSDMGWVDAGYRADLVVVSGRPEEDIDALRNIQSVYKNGERVFDTSNPTLDPWVSASEGVCLDDRDCAKDSACDGVTSTCGEACPLPYAVPSGCDPTTWCMPQDGLGATPQGVCHAERTCDHYAQDCSPSSYNEACIPRDLDTSVCWPGGPQRAGQLCSWEDPALFCEAGNYCSPYTGRCFEICDPEDPAACADCTLVEAEGEPWFGLCY